MPDPEPAPASPPAPKAEPAPAPQPDPAGELKELRREIEKLRSDLWAKIEERLPKPADLSTPKPPRGFKPGVFKGR